ncbi:MAG: 2-iminoacetate synthase ThiH [bacterium]|nr:2-iminoacetate synthase ThiH [bacterium]
MSFLERLNSLDIPTTLKGLDTITEARVKQVLSRPTIQFSDFPVLISPAAQSFLEPMAQRAKQLTEQRFGRTMSLFAPLYLSNYCYNQCTYCGFSMEQKLPRKVLSDEEIMAEVHALKKRGFAHVLVLTGEAPDIAGVDYLEHAILLMAPHFSSIGLEVQPLKQHEYERLIKAGVSTLTVYQETYERHSYAKHHPKGKKGNFDLRIPTAEYGGAAGMFRVNLGALLGLSDWRYEAIALSEHMHYMRQHHWRVRLGMSFPRIQKMVGNFDPPFPISDAELVQYICAFRLVFPDLIISLSTREKPLLRDSLMHIAITEMSAESCTDPGGYSGLGELEQFETSDKRTLIDVCELLARSGFDPVLRDWEPSLSC